MNKITSTAKVFLCILTLTAATTVVAVNQNLFNTFKERIQHTTKKEKIYAGTFALNALIFAGKKVRSRPLISIPVYIIFSLLCANSIAPKIN